MAQRRIRKARWPDGILSFPQGLDTYHPVGQIPATALAKLENAEGTVSGAWQTRRGRAAYLPSLGASPIMGLYELALVTSTTYLLVVYGGKLYKESAGAWVNLPIRLYKPYPPYPDDSTAGERLNGSPLKGVVERTTGAAAGANLVASRRYRYAAHAVKGAGTTLISDVTGTMVVLMSATPKAVDVTLHGCYGADSYTIWRSESTDGGVTWSSWGRMATGVTHITTGGKTLVQWADDGSIVPNTGVATPSSNTTEHILPSAQRVDWETWDASWNGENAAYFIAGDGFCRTDGTNAEIVTPTLPSAYMESAAGINALADVTWPGHHARGLIRHQEVLFFGDVADKPNVFYWSRALDPSHSSQLAAIEVPARGGRILDFKVKDAQLGVGVTTGIWSLLGTSFAPTGPSSDVYFSEATDIGVSSEWSMIRAPHGWLQWVATDRRLRALAHLQPDKERTDVFEVGEAIRPTMDELTDHENAVGMWAEDQWILAFPADQKMLRLYQRTGPNGMIVAPVVDTATALGALLRRRDGTLIGAHATTGQLYKLLQPATFTDDGQTYTFRLQTVKIDAGNPVTRKKWRWVRVYYDVNGQTTLNYRLETVEGVVEDSISLAGTGGYDDGMYDVATYDPWTLPYVELDFGEEGPHCQVTLWCTGYVRIYGLAFEMDIKR